MENPIVDQKLQELHTLKDSTTTIGAEKKIAKINYSYSQTLSKPTTHYIDTTLWSKVRGSFVNLVKLSIKNIILIEKTLEGILFKMF